MSFQQVESIRTEDFDAAVTVSGDWWHLTAHGDQPILLNPVGFTPYTLYELTVRVGTSSSNKTITLRHGEMTFKLPRYSSHTITLHYDGSPIELLGADSLHWHAPSSKVKRFVAAEEGTPASQISVEMEIYNLYDAFALNSSRLDDATLDAAPIPANTIVLDSESAILNTYRLLDRATEWKFVPVMDGMSQVKVTRGVEVEGAALAAQIGTATFVIPKARDPRSMRITKGVEVRIVNFKLRKVLFTGKIESVQISPVKETGYNTVTITAHDRVAELASIARYGNVTDEKELPEDRIRRLLAPHEIPYLLEESFNPNNLFLTRTVYESSLVQHLDLVANSLSSPWYIRADNAVIFTGDSNATDPLFKLSDRVNPSFIEADATWQSSEISTAIKVTNLKALLNEDAEWNAYEETYTALDPKGRWKAWGMKTTEVTTNLYAGAAALAQRLAQKAADAMQLREVTIDSLNNPELASTELMTRIDTEFRGENQIATITGIIHTIRPDFWHTTFTLTRIR
ncbi:hypothetical protein [Boudabousia marimammalium]|uniref:Uncharacterized protein n=1 Tax=Boudabousia marimammalium TaxID=156892 RepID=A0A1Q5PP06_9ACTO|nr:hypothetical protein [Boudabousia marimammalium]OKL49293.1 hypothetical protein BM477_04740 [Boudabousia marimammalium]